MGAIAVFLRNKDSKVKFKERVGLRLLDLSEIMKSLPDSFGATWGGNNIIKQIGSGIN